MDLIIFRPKVAIPYESGEGRFFFYGKTQWFSSLFVAQGPFLVHFGSKNEGFSSFFYAYSFGFYRQFYDLVDFGLFW
jgi:hypothetical protein